MGKIKKYIYLVGAYQLGKPLYDFMEHYCNNEHRGKKEGISNEERIRSLYNPSGNKTAIVTGASEGIGRCISLDLAKSGF
jgi:short-subunit dehydrogenase